MLHTRIESLLVPMLDCISTSTTRTTCSSPETLISIENPEKQKKRKRCCKHRVCLHNARGDVASAKPMAPDRPGIFPKTIRVTEAWPYIPLHRAYSLSTAAHKAWARPFSTLR